MTLIVCDASSEMIEGTFYVDFTVCGAHVSFDNNVNSWGVLLASGCAANMFTGKHCELQVACQRHATQSMQ